MKSSTWPLSVQTMLDQVQVTSYLGSSYIMGRGLGLDIIRRIQGMMKQVRGRCNA